MKPKKLLISIGLAAGLMALFAGASGPAVAQPQPVKAAGPGVSVPQPAAPALADSPILPMPRAPLSALALLVPQVQESARGLPAPRAPEAVPELPMPQALNEPGKELDPGLIEVCPGCEEADLVIEASGLEADFPDVWAAKMGDPNGKNTFIQYNAKADPARVAEFLARLDPITELDLPMPIRGRQVDFSQAEIDRHLKEIAANADEYAKRLGIDDFCSWGPDYRTGVIWIGVCHGFIPGTVPDIGFPVEVVASGLTIPLIAR